MEIPEDHENKAICKACGGHCCKRCGCELFPEDFKNNIITKETIVKKLSQGFCFDYWEGNPSGNSRYNNIIFYYMRAKNKNAKDKIVDASWGGECIFLNENGCSLKKSERPSGGKAMIPNKKYPKCTKIEGYEKRDCAIAWLPYNKIIVNIINTPRTIKTIDCDSIRELKSMGKHKEVKILLKTFYKDVKKSGKQALSEYDAKIRKIDKFKGICSTMDCLNKVVKGYSKCEYCLIIQQGNFTRRYIERKKKGICVACGREKEADNKTLRCNRCRAIQKKKNDEYRLKK